MYKGGLLVLQALSMYSCRVLLCDSQLYSSCSLVRDLSCSSILDSLVDDLAHFPMSSSIFLFSYKTMSRTVEALCFNNIRSVLKCMILSQKSFTGNSSALLNVFVFDCTRCPMTNASTWIFDWPFINDSSCILSLSCWLAWSFLSYRFITTGSSFDSPWVYSS